MDSLIKVSVGLVLVVNTPQGEEIVLVDNDNCFGIPQATVNQGESVLVSAKNAMNSIGLDMNMKNLQYLGTGEFVDDNGQHNVVILFSAMVAEMTKLETSESDMVVFSVNKNEIGTDLPSISEATKLVLRINRQGSFIPFSDDSIKNAISSING